MELDHQAFPSQSGDGHTFDGAHGSIPAQAPNQAKSAFLAAVSYAIRTPISNIVGYSEMLQEEAQERGDLHLISDLEKIRVAGQDLLSLIEDILDLSETNQALQREIAERRRAEEELRRSEAATRAIVTAAADGIISMDERGRIESFNPAAERIFQCEAGQVLGRGIDTLIAIPCLTAESSFSVSSSAPFESCENLALQTGHETVGRRPNGALFPIDLALTEVLVDEHQVFIGIVRDITAQKQLQYKQIAAHQAALEASRLKSEFVANMSHELRTPMNAIMGMTGLLLDTDLNVEQQGYVDIIRRGSDTMLTVINDILDFSKIESGRLELEQAPFDLRLCIEDALDLLAPKAAEKDLELGYLLDDDSPVALMGDVTRIRQILVNLLSNAIKFTASGEVMVSISSRQLTCEEILSGLTATEVPADPPQSTYEIHFAVADTGIGIPPERMNRLFLAFSQVDASTTRRYGGTGLGLVICKRLTEMMGGSIWVESEVEHGSTFHFTVIAPSVPSPIPAYLSGPQSILEGRSVLIVDDHATSRRILTRHLQSWGMLPQATDSTEEALHSFECGERFSAAILDGHLPGINDLVSAIHTRADREDQAVLVIMLTSVTRQESIGTDRAVCLTKPIKASNLYDVLVRTLARSGVDSGQTSAEARPHRSPRDHKSLRILVAEDNPINQKVTLLILKRMGYRADTVANGIEALEAVQRRRYDVVLMDVQMPEMDGLEATRRIGATWLREERPWIIAMTAHAMRSDREACLAAGMDDYISKPVQIEDLQAALARLGSAGQAPASLPPSSSDSPAEVFDPILSAELLELREGEQLCSSSSGCGEVVAVPGDARAGDRVQTP